MKTLYIIPSLAMTALAVMAEAPAGYYDSLYGLTGASLKQAVARVAADHNVISYGDKTWQAFETTDVREVDGKVIWFDMYSNVMELVANGHNGLNIEHSVANSWWGGKSGSVEAYSDLYLLNPSNSDANNRKSNWPLGEVANASWTNGLSRLGTPVAGQGGGSTTVFEPADEYKGDFARAFFYVFTVYADIPWQESPAYMYDAGDPLTLRPWACRMLLDWAQQDPVDSREAERNEQIAKLQGNRNPYIDMPLLADYIWGDEAGNPFSEAGTVREIVNRPAAPVFVGMEMPALNTYAGRWWNTTQITLTTATGQTWVSLDGAPYVICDGTVTIPAALSDGETHTLSAYTVGDEPGNWLRSAVSTCTLTAKDPEVIDLKDASWRLVTSDADINDENSYILVSVKNHGVMNTAVSTTSSSWSLGSDWKAEPEDDIISGVRENTAVLNLETASTGGVWYVGVNDISLRPLGYLSSTAAKKMTIAPQGSEVEIRISANGDASLNFGQGIGSIWYNASQPRFSTYTSTTLERVSLYRHDPSLTGVGAMGEDSYSIRVVDGILVAPAGTRLYDMQGLPADPTQSHEGIFIVVTPKGAYKIVF